MPTSDKGEQFRDTGWKSAFKYGTISITIQCSTKWSTLCRTLSFLVDRVYVARQGADQIQSHDYCVPLLTTIKTKQDAYKYGDDNYTTQRLHHSIQLTLVTRLPRRQSQTARQRHIVLTTESTLGLHETANGQLKG